MPASDASLDRALNEPVDLRPFDPAWQSRFAAESARLASTLPTRFVRIAHVGSTAVPGMMAKPVIDMLAALPDWGLVDQALRELDALGYHHDAASPAQAPDRRWLLRHHDGRRTHHLHLVRAGSAAWQERIDFRDRLAGDPLLRGAYLAVKFRLVCRMAGRRDGYTAGKAPFIADALRRPPRPARPVRSARALAKLLQEVARSTPALQVSLMAPSNCIAFREWIAARDPRCCWVIDAVASGAVGRELAAPASTVIPKESLDAAALNPAHWAALATIAVAAAELLGPDATQSPPENR